MNKTAQVKGCGHNPQVLNFNILEEFFERYTRRKANNEIPMSVGHG